MIKANQSVYQMSTPLGNRKRRLSESVVLSHIHPCAEKKKLFVTESDDDEDFEVKKSKIICPLYLYYSIIYTCMRVRVCII